MPIDSLLEEDKQFFGALEIVKNARREFDALRLDVLAPPSEIRASSAMSPDPNVCLALCRLKRAFLPFCERINHIVAGSPLKRVSSILSFICRRQLQS